MRSAHFRISVADILVRPVVLDLFSLFMEMEAFICAGEIPLVVSAIGVNLTGKVWADSVKIVTKLVSYLSCNGYCQSTNFKGRL